MRHHHCDEECGEKEREVLHFGKSEREGLKLVFAQQALNECHVGYYKRVVSSIYKQLGQG